MISVFQQHWQELLVGFGNTLLCSVIALFFSLIIGSTFAIFEVLPSRFLHILGRVYIEVFRNIPLLVIGMFFYAVVPQYVVSINGFTAGTIGLTLYTSAFIAETVRAGIQAVDEGQMEGARANGLTFMQAMWQIVLPQAFRYVIPPLGNQFINMVKNSSVLAFVAGFDLMYQGDLIASTTFDTFNTYIAVGILYLIITLPLSYYMRYLEKKMG
ncbi:amino acid ABC transporter permease [Liquorilactobacillus satsumensis]|uniref:Glutamine transport system permease n=1 Tax=Liquorilactobacillus satsumensis DSM 16230 = JCM 12392 TaxID=1423801 RepID=A0A0R1UV03_9LACO|nr:amino acid ABC transporter permease [Liquorilactobacillus satsumensis]KRL97020.1 glutamine transport system permease [Liquorilactobacillus satsumensis DSM 16230 = JCM 12392]MCC7666195.1 amino acid ABC transporter permease [Liquorilactobacillus satsumensis]MCP9313485.1 amino acid ABC transporter permease [Liquorilactobacillus satsumensis]MCP9329124.1 amino acid ABC transporter permease [Liquorilactobacillus satsumensis]MCP9357462.1 amino acid ABC transporter permease [Liquorilactobacillus sa